MVAGVMKHGDVFDLLNILYLKRSFQNKIFQVVRDNQNLLPGDCLGRQPDFDKCFFTFF